MQSITIILTRTIKSILNNQGDTANASSVQKSKANQRIFQKKKNGYCLIVTVVVAKYNALKPSQNLQLENPITIFRINYTQCASS